MNDMVKKNTLIEMIVDVVLPPDSVAPIKHAPVKQQKDTFTLEDCVTPEIFDLVMRTYYDHLIACKTVDELNLRSAYVVCSCIRMSPHELTLSDGRDLVYFVAGVIKNMLDKQKLCYN